MSGLRFEYQVVSNFQSLGDVEFPLDKLGMIAIRGRNLDDTSALENGCGKTALLDSIVCTLYGRIPRYAKQVNGSQIINRHRGDTTCTLTLIFSVGKNRYRVWRSYTKKSHKLRLTQNDQDISEASIPKTQEKIIQLVGTYQAFLNSIMFGRGVISRFVKADKVERGEIVASLVMDTESFDEVRKKTEKAYAQAQTDLSLIAEKLEAGKIARESKREDLQSIKDDLKQLQFQNKEELKSLKPPKPVKDTISSSTKKIQQLVCKVDRLKHKRDGLKERMNYGFGKLSEMQSYCDILEMLDSSHCPVCLSDISNVQRNKILDRFKHEMKISQAKCGKIRDKSYTLRDKVIVLETEIRELTQEQDHVRDELVKYDLTRMAYLNAKSRASEREAKAWERLTYAKNAFVDSKAAVKRLVQIQKEFRQKAKDLTFLRKAFSSKGIMAEVVKTVCPKLTMLSQQFVSRFLGGGYRIEFVPELVTFRGEERLSFDIHASVEKGGGEYAACSDGEQERIDTCVGLALRYLVSSRFGHKVNLLAFDERFSGLDTLGSEKVMELITEEAKKQSSVLVVSHQEHLQSFFEKQWTVVKKNGIARLET